MRLFLFFFPPIFHPSSSRAYLDMALVLPLQLLGELLYLVLQSANLSCCPAAGRLQPPLPILYFC